MFTVTAAAALAGMNQEEVSNLIFAGLLKPADYVISGGKQRALLSDRNVSELKVVKRLRTAGIKRNYIKSILTLLNSSRQSWWDDSNVHIVIGDGEKWYITTNAFEVNNVDGMKNNQTTVIVKL